MRGDGIRRELQMATFNIACSSLNSQLLGPEWDRLFNVGYKCITVCIFPIEKFDAPLVSLEQQNHFWWVVQVIPEGSCGSTLTWIAQTS